MKCLLFFLAGFMMAISAHAQLSLSSLFRDHAVLQRDINIPVKGLADPGAQVSVDLAGVDLTTTAEDDGSWQVTFPAFHAGGPFTLHVESSAESITIEDIWFGDVWFCSGQSNMEWPVASSNNAEEEIAMAKDPMIRHYDVPHAGSFVKKTAFPEQPWQVCSPETAGAFTAVGYFFARELRKAIDVPIGLIHSSWGGSRIEAWMRAETLGYRDNADAEAAHARRIRRALKKSEKAVKGKFGNLGREDQGMQDGVPVWATEEFDSDKWGIASVPGLWEESVLPNFDGIVWYRKTIEVPAEVARRGGALHLMKIDDSDITWINGIEVGKTKMDWNKSRKYTIPANVLKPGKNTITVRIEDTGGGGGFHGDAANFVFTSGAFRQSLIGPWYYRPGAVYHMEPVRPNHTPTKLYNDMVNPALGFPIKGVLWYQGESNAGPDDAHIYRTQFKTMITDWRDQWGMGDFPFLFVQLANFTEVQEDPGESDWAVLRESQSAALELPRTAQAVTIDIGEADDIHPRNKQDVGRRLALAARKVAYGEDLVWSGPVFREKEISGSRIILHFDHAGSGLVSQGGPLKGFAIAGHDGVYHWAKASIKDDTVVVWSENVQDPEAVRYAWADNPEGANLYNAEGLPASPFRTE